MAKSKRSTRAPAAPEPHPTGYFGWSRDPAVGLFAVLPLWLLYEALRLRLAPNEPRVHFNLGSALEQGGRPAEAADSYRNALRAGPDFAPAQQALDRLVNTAADRAGTAPR